MHTNGLTHPKGNGAHHARAAGLTYVSDGEPGIARMSAGSGFRYRGPDGRPVGAETIARIRKIAVPPAWTDVWISPSPDGHIQATGRDARGRKQYRYHPDFRSVRESAKYDHLVDFAAVLPKLRRRIEEDMSRPGLPREKVIATIVHLLDTTLIRVGNADYARQNGSFGLTTLRDRHVDIDGSALRFEFKGKSGKTWQLEVKDRRVARIVKSCQELPGQHLFQYVDADSQRQSVGSADVNSYLREATGREITAKDFRTWAGTILAAIALRSFPAFDSQATAKANVRAAIEEVAEQLGNTAAICRKCYVHPAIVESYLAGDLAFHHSRPRAHLKAEEVAALAFLKSRLARSRRRPPANAASAGHSQRRTRPLKSRYSAPNFASR